MPSFDDEHPYLIQLTVPTEDHLKNMAGTLELAKIPHCVYHEPDFGDAATAIATAPVTEAQRKHFRRWPLL